MSNYSKNAVKILPYIDRVDDYLCLYSEFDSGFEIGDQLYIMVYNGSCKPYLDSYDTMNINNNICDSVGVKLINKINNKLILDINYEQVIIANNVTILSTDDIYISRVYILKSVVNGGNINGLMCNSISLNPVNSLSVTWIQGVILESVSNISNIRFNKKYTSSTPILKTLIGDDIVNYYTKNNDDIGLSVIGCTSNKITLIDCIINEGTFTNCTFETVGTSSILTFGGGKLIDSIIVNKCVINYAYLIRTSVKNIYSLWNNGRYYDNEKTATFNVSRWENGTWEDGIFPSTCVWNNGRFLNGTFKNSTWYNGHFIGGLFTGSTWVKGTFTNGVFENSSWYDGLFVNGTITNKSSWTKGTFKSGLFEKSIWKNGDFNGTFNNSEWANGHFKGGVFKGTSKWLNGYFYDGTFEYSTFSKGNIYNIEAYNSNISNAVISNARISASVVNDSIIYYSVVNDRTELNDCVWYDGIANNASFNNTEWYNGVANYAILTKSNWYNGSFNNGIFGLESDITNTIWHNGYFYFGTFNGVWKNGSFYYGNIHNKNSKTDMAYYSNGSAVNINNISDRYIKDYIYSDVNKTTIVNIIEPKFIIDIVYEPFTTSGLSIDSTTIKVPKLKK